MTSPDQNMSNNYGVCPKCGFKRVAKEGTYRMESRYAMSLFFVDAYTCGNCGYVELYKKRG